MIQKTILIETKRREEMVNITPQLKEFIRSSSVKDGRLMIFVPHTTAAITINENADPSVPRDITFALNRISPKLKEFTHLEGNADAHVKSSLIGCSQDVLIENGELLLGTWQGIFFCEFDGPRTRKAILRLN